MRDVYVERDVLAPGRLFLSFKSALSSLHYLGTIIGSQFYFLEDIIALYLYIAKKRAENFLGSDVTRIVLGRPVRFSFDPRGNDLARERLLKAAFRAGYDEVYLQYEPIAAAHYYELGIEREQNVLIFDFGGGTLDISVLRIGGARQQVLANGGIPVAGDVFDQKMVRATLPRHFGEGTFYRAGGKLLPVPSNWFESFSSWQEMLNLQTPKFFEAIKQVEMNAQEPQRIRALRHLISSNYGLKMFDVVEAVKQQLSSAERSTIRLHGPEFSVDEPVTRQDFERIIRSDVRAIDSYLDQMLAEAGLKAGDINAVIRTGGSSQIPAFVQMLEGRFGRDKVRSIDLYSSVTSGLGIIAHRIESGQYEAQVYRRTDYQGSDRLDRVGKDGVLAIEFDALRRLVDVNETTASANEDTVILVGLTTENKVYGTVMLRRMFTHENADLSHSNVNPGHLATLLATKADTPLLIATSDYRFMLKTAQHLANLDQVGVGLAETEGFLTDVFGDEFVSGLTPWGAAGEWSLLVTSSGHFKPFRREFLAPRIEQPVPYHIPRLRGYPLTLLSVNQDDEVIALTATGRAVRAPAAALVEKPGRMLPVSSKDALVAVYAYRPPQDFLLLTSSGDCKAVSAHTLPLADRPGAGAVRLISRGHLSAVLPQRADHTFWMITTGRVVPLNAGSQPTGFRLQRDETVVGLVGLPDS